MKQVEIVGIDAGGTMTDTLIVDSEGKMVVGKAATTPHNESIGFSNSLRDGFSQMGLEMESVAELDGVIYSGTAMLNTLLQRKGDKVGLLVTKGMEDYLLMERGCQSYLGYHYADRLHSVTHVSNPPLIPRHLIRGIGGRIDFSGREVIPLYEWEVENAVEYLVSEGVQSICICFASSYVNPVHELAAGDVCKRVIGKVSNKIFPIFLSSELQPVWREASRLNCAVIEAYASGHSRTHLVAVNEKLKENNFKKELQIMQAHGGITNYKTARAFKSLISGPIGGIIGSKYVGDVLGAPNIICTDMGGTSFDVGLITAGHFALNPEPDLARFKLNLPMVAVDSIGAGTGTIIKVDGLSKHIELGPESVGAYPGPLCYGNQTDSPSICDCDVITGIINPDYYLGGTVKIRVDRAVEIFKSRIADALKLDVYEAAAGMIDLVESRMRDHLHAMVLGRGFETMDYHLFAYGGSGPMHAANYSKNLEFRGICIPAWAPAFSAFGCTCADYTHRYDNSLLFVIPPGGDDLTKVALGNILTQKWRELKEQAVTEFIQEGYKEETISYKPYLRMMYAGQLDALEIAAPTMDITSPQSIDEIVANFEALYEKIYARAGKFTEAGYQATEVVLLASVESAKPKVSPSPLADRKPSKDAFKVKRQVYWKDTWKPFDTWEMDRIVPGNIIEGAAIIEHPATTYVIPPGYFTVMDAFRIFWLKK